MRMMGAESVGYHEHTVAGRGDDPVSGALDYYASRNETPMRWGGSGAAWLGLDGEVDLDEWRAVFATGGAHHPLSGERLVGCMRPGMEIVVSPHKTVAELGVIGRAEDMHLIVDAERDATMAYLDEVVMDRGGRRGRAQVRTPTSGLTWAVSRHATTRAGDPQVHDHVLVANVVRMSDERGGWKGLDTGLLRDHLHAATAVGRMAAAAKAVELGYGIEADPGPSGRLGGWAIAGIPRDAWEVHATRSAQIDEAVGPDASYHARSVAARATRDRKAHEPVEDLVVRWRDELARAGYPPVELGASVERAGLAYQSPGMDVLDRVGDELLSRDGRLSQEKTFTRSDVIVAVAPMLHGLPVSVLDRAVDSVLSHEHAVALPLVTGAREPVWAAACVVEDEQRIAALADVLTEREGPRVDRQAAFLAVRQLELSRGVRLSERQAEVAKGLLASGHSLDLVVGVAGSGKTTTLAAVRSGFESAGYQVIGTATSGQAAKALGEGAGIGSRTVASLTWRLEHEREVLSPRHVLILDESGMTSDADVGRLLAAVEASGAKLVAVGDYRQLDAVGPGGALEALSKRHPGHVWALRDNLRQVDPAERHALGHLRAGHVPTAVNWYLGQGRVHPAPSRGQATSDMVMAWAADVAGGRDAVMVAYHRDSVEALNRAARAVWGRLGRLSGPELEAPGGRRYRAGDRVVTLSPGPDGAWVTSQRAVVTSVDVEARALTAVTPEGTELHIGPEHIGADKLGHAYAVTAHRCQGATVDVTHALEDGGGRELAYVAMSRARHESHVHVVAHDATDAAERLAWAWEQQRRQTWALDKEPVKSLAELYVERNRLAASVPADHSAELDRHRQQLARLDQDARDLADGTGRWAGTSAGGAARAARDAAVAYQRAQQVARDEGLGWWARHKARAGLRDVGARFDAAVQAWRAVGEPEAQLLEARRRQVAPEVARLEKAQHAREAFLVEHPDLPGRISDLGRAIEAREQLEDMRRLQVLREREQARQFQRGHELQPDLGYGIDL
jgi:conjugative relaxase-like TrwC/TraI family protein